MSNMPEYERFGEKQQSLFQDIDILDASGENRLPPRSYKIPQASLLNKLQHQRSGQTLNQKSNRSNMNDDLHSDLQGTSQKGQNVAPKPPLLHENQSQN